MKKNLAEFKLNNKGISILELVVVIAIMSVIGVTLFLATSVATDRHVTSCTNKISTAIEQTRSLTLGKQSGKIKFWVNANGEICAQLYINGTEYGNEVEIGHTGLTVKFIYVYAPNPGMVVRRELGSIGSGEIELEFSRSTGGVTRQVVGGTTEIAPEYLLKSIEVTNGHRTMTITVDTYTGRVNVNT